jgi:hypothetical protein
MPNEQFNQSFERLNELRIAIEKHLGSIVENVRWLATLVRAEMGGLAAYQKLVGPDANRLTLFVTAIIFILSIVLVLFVFISLKARAAHDGIGEIVDRFRNEARDIVRDINKTPRDAVLAIQNTESEASAALSAVVGPPGQIEKFGLAIFGVISFVIGVFVLSSEIVMGLLSALGLVR